MERITIGFIIGGVVMAIFFGWLATRAMDTADKTNYKLDALSKGVEPRDMAYNDVMTGKMTMLEYCDMGFTDAASIEACNYYKSAIGMK